MPKTKPNVFDGQSITASEFFSNHWQRSPYLFRNTSIDLSCLPTIEQMFGLAAQEDVQSRIVFSEDDVHYQAIYDEPKAWQEVQSLKPTMLVSDVEKWFPQANKIMNWFPFIKNWRFDDLMMSFAPTGASVGAHTDHYDVFLIQVQGSRQWAYDDQPLADCNRVEDSELSVIADYQAKFTETLNPGDVLYLPPEIPHHGISTSDDCVTCSIGLRAPSDSELLNNFTELLTQTYSESDRFKDNVKLIDSDASIGSHEINYLRQRLTEMSQLSDEALASLFGQIVTSYRVFDDFDLEDSMKLSSTNKMWKKSPFSVFAYHLTDETNATLMVNGECFNSSTYMAQMICNHESFSLHDLQSQSANPISDLRVFKELINLRHIIAA